MSRSLSRGQAIVLGFVVLIALGGAAWSVWAIGTRQGLWNDTFTVRVGFSNVHDIGEGTPVRLRGVEVGRVTAIEFADAPAAGEPPIWLWLSIDQKYFRYLHADAKASIRSKSPLGGYLIAIDPGTPSAGPFQGEVLRGQVTPDLHEAVAQLTAVASRAETMAAKAESALDEFRSRNGTVQKLLKDDDLYQDLKSIAQEARSLVRNVDQTLGAVRSEVDGLKTFVRSGQETVDAIRQDAEAMKKLPIVGSYVEDPVDVLIRPNMRRERRWAGTQSLFEPNSAILTDTGRAQVLEWANWLNGNRHKRSEIVVAVYADPKNEALSPAGLVNLTRSQAEAITELLKEQSVHKVGWPTRRKVTPIGMGARPSPMTETEKIPAARVEVLFFLPSE